MAIKHPVASRATLNQVISGAKGALNRVAREKSLSDEYMSTGMDIKTFLAKSAQNNEQIILAKAALADAVLAVNSEIEAIQEGEKSAKKEENAEGKAEASKEENQTAAKEEQKKPVEANKGSAELRQQLSELKAELQAIIDLPMDASLAVKEPQSKLSSLEEAKTAYKAALESLKSAEESREEANKALEKAREQAPDAAGAEDNAENDSDAQLADNAGNDGDAEQVAVANSSIKAAEAAVEAADKAVNEANAKAQSLYEKLNSLGIKGEIALLEIEMNHLFGADFKIDAEKAKSDKEEDQEYKEKVKRFKDMQAQIAKLKEGDVSVQDRFERALSKAGEILKSKELTSESGFKAFFQKVGAKIIQAYRAFVNLFKFEDVYTDLINAGDDSNKALAALRNISSAEKIVLRKLGAGAAGDVSTIVNRLKTVAKNDSSSKAFRVSTRLLSSLQGVLVMPFKAVGFVGSKVIGLFMPSSQPMDVHAAAEVLPLAKLFVHNLGAKAKDLISEEENELISVDELPTAIQAEVRLAAEAEDVISRRFC